MNKNHPHPPRQPSTVVDKALTTTRQFRTESAGAGSRRGELFLKALARSGSRGDIAGQACQLSNQFEEKLGTKIVASPGMAQSQIISQTHQQGGTGK